LKAFYEIIFLVWFRKNGGKYGQTKNRYFLQAISMIIISDKSL